MPIQFQSFFNVPAEVDKVIRSQISKDWCVNNYESWYKLEGKKKAMTVAWDIEPDNNNEKTLMGFACLDLICERPEEETITYLQGSGRCETSPVL